MKILLVVTKAEMGGAQKRIIDLAAAYQAAGHSVAVASGPGEYLPGQLGQQGIEHVSFSMLSRANPFKIIGFIFSLCRFLRRRTFDVVHLNSSSALVGALAAKLARPAPKTVFTFRGLSILAPGYRAGWLKKAFFKASYQLFLPFVDVGVFQCEANQRSAHALGIRANSERVIKDGIKTDAGTFLSRAAARKRLEKLAGVDLAGKQVIGSIGRLSYQKNYDFLIRALKKLAAERADTVCIIIGGGPKEKELRAQIHRLDLEERVFLVGTQADAAKLLRGFDVFTLTSRYEGLSMTLTEALHAGVPLLVSRVGAAPEVVEEERMLYAEGEEGEFRQKLERLLQAPAKRWATEPRGGAGELVLEKSAGEYVDLYKQLCQQ